MSIFSSSFCLFSATIQDFGLKTWNMLNDIIWKELADINLENSCFKGVKEPFIITSLRGVEAVEISSQTALGIWVYGLKLVHWQADELDSLFMPRKNSRWKNWKSYMVRCQKTTMFVLSEMALMIKTIQQKNYSSNFFEQVTVQTHSWKIYLVRRRKTVASFLTIQSLKSLERLYQKVRQF